MSAPVIIASPTLAYSGCPLSVWWKEWKSRFKFPPSLTDGCATLNTWWVLFRVSFPISLECWDDKIILMCQGQDKHGSSLSWLWEWLHYWKPWLKGQTWVQSLFSSCTSYVSVGKTLNPSEIASLLYNMVLTILPCRLPWEDVPCSMPPMEFAPSQIHSFIYSFISSSAVVNAHYM